jgi:hypothetical protein
MSHRFKKLWREPKHLGAPEFNEVDPFRPLISSVRIRRDQSSWQPLRRRGERFDAPGFALRVYLLDRFREGTFGAANYQAKRGALQDKRQRFASFESITPFNWR